MPKTTETRHRSQAVINRKNTIQNFHCFQCTCFVRVTQVAGGKTRARTRKCMFMYVWVPHNVQSGHMRHAGQQILWK